MGKLERFDTLDDLGFTQWKALAHKIQGGLESIKLILSGDLGIELVNRHLFPVYNDSKILLPETNGGELLVKADQAKFRPLTLQDTDKKIEYMCRTRCGEAPEAQVEVFDVAPQARESVRKFFLLPTKPFTEHQVVTFCRIHADKLSESNLFLIDIRYDKPVVANVQRNGDVLFWLLSRGQYVFPPARVFFLK